MDRFIDLSVFVRVVEDKSFASAARHFNMSPASVSTHVRELEERLGARLLNRTTRSVNLTDVGRAFYDRAKRILTDLDVAETAAGELQTAPRGLLRVNTMPSFTGHMTPAICDFIAKYPLVSVELHATARHIDLVEEGIDIAIRGADGSADSNLIARRLAPISVVVVGAPAYFAEHPVPETPADLTAHNCLTLSHAEYAGEWRFTGPGDSDFHIAVRGNLQSNLSEVLRAAALRGQGLTRQPTFVVGDDVKSGRLVPVLTDYNFREAAIMAFFPHGRLLATKTRTFIDFLVARFGPNPYWDDWCRAKTAA